ncbi:MAG: Flp family type IVb pilin [Kiloniellales bacterium]|nr:Flp family type IVb pilin [Kiloniellales bacterium]
MFKSLHAFANDESGATAIEYGLIAALIAVAAIGALEAIGTSLDTLFKGVDKKLEDGIGKL